MSLQGKRIARGPILCYNSFVRKKGGVALKAKGIILLLAFLLLLSACGQQADGEAGGRSPEGQQSLPLSLSESQAMARLLNANRVLFREDSLFCYDFDSDWTPVLARYTWKDGKLSGFRVLAEGCVPEYLCWLDGWLCYINRESGALERVSDQGGERQLMRQGPCSCLCLRDGLLYYCDETGRYLALDMAHNADTLILEGPCAFAWPMEDGVLYQEAGSGRIWLRRGEGSVRSLSPEGASPPLLLEDRVWYTYAGSLVSRSLSGGEDRVYALPEHVGDLELLPGAEGLCLRGIREADGIVQWEGGIDGPFEDLDRGYRICDWLGGGLRVDTVYEPDGRIRCYLLQDEAGTELSFLAGKIE